MSKINLSNISLNNQNTLINNSSKSISTIYSNNNSSSVYNSNVSLILENGIY